MTLLDTFLPVFPFNEFHQVLVETAPADLLYAVNLPGILDDPWVKRFIGLRETPGCGGSRQYMVTYGDPGILQ